jgi:hypothetical protein
VRFTALLHHVYDIEHLRQTYHALKREAAPGIDGETWEHYGVALEENLQDLSGRLKRGAYRARPVKRAYIPKADGRRRPLGIPTLEDKLVQRATANVLNAVYEADFLGFSDSSTGRRPSGSWGRCARGWRSFTWSCIRSGVRPVCGRAAAARRRREAGGVHLSRVHAPVRGNGRRDA